MEALQWTMTIPQDKQSAFISFYNQTIRSTWLKFGAIKCELFKTLREKVTKDNYFPEEQFVETIYLKEGLTAKEFFEQVKANPEAWEISRQYEKQFDARDIVMKVLINIYTN